MDRETLAKRLHQVIVNTLELPVDTDSDSLKMGVVHSWDSLNHVLLMMEIESEFNIDVPSQEVPKWASFDYILDALVDMLAS